MMTTPLIVEIVISVLLVISGIFGLVGSYALVKLPDQMTRLHGPTKSATLGVGGVLLASLAYFAFVLETSSWHELLISLFLFLTAPVTGMMIAKTHMFLSWRADELPDPENGSGWATYGDGNGRSLMERNDPEEPPEPARYTP